MDAKHIIGRQHLLQMKDRSFYTALYLFITNQNATSYIQDQCCNLQGNEALMAHQVKSDPEAREHGPARPQWNTEIKVEMRQALAAWSRLHKLYYKAQRQTS